VLKLSLCIELFWPERPFAERIGLAAEAGFAAYEFWGWWDKDLDMVEKATKDAGLLVAVCCVKTSFMADVPSILAPGGDKALVAAVKDTLAAVGRLGCKTFIVTTGNALEGVPRADQRAACVQALRAASTVAEDAGVTLVLEPLNVLVDHPGYYLTQSGEAFDIVAEVGRPALKILFDIYHQQITEGNLTPTIADNIDNIGHFHVADHPGRHEPMAGEINYGYVFRRIAELPYEGYIGLEFAPSDPAKTNEILRDVQALAR